MLAKILSAVNEGLDSHLVEVEADVSSGFPAFEIVGLPDKAVSESKERVRSAIINSGFKFLPGNKKRLIVNLAPADIKKEGSVYDLPIALGVLFASEQISFTSLQVEPGQKPDSVIASPFVIARSEATKQSLPLPVIASAEGAKQSLPLPVIASAEGAKQSLPLPVIASAEGAKQSLPLPVIASAEGAKQSLPIINNSLFIGELSLNGELRHTKGVLPMAILAKKKGLKNVYVPKDNTEEASLVDGVNVYPLNSLKDLLSHLLNQQEIVPFKSTRDWKEDLSKIQYEYDFKYIKGQEFIKRALEIAAAGGHNVLMIGAPGSGKTLLARAMPSILPLMNKEEILEVTKIYSVTGLLRQNEYLKNQRPFRSPHHTTSDVAMVGGGQVPHPGEVSLAHRGVLFLDELAHFKRTTLESLRQPLEDGEIFVSRARGSVSYPAKFILVASMNPCLCGYYGDSEKECKCSAGEIIRYRRKISGPFLDRIDLHLDVPRVKIDKLMDKEVAESSEKIRKRIKKARQAQSKRFSSRHCEERSVSRHCEERSVSRHCEERSVSRHCEERSDEAIPQNNPKTMTNSEMTITQIKKICQLDQASEKLLKDALEKFILSARAYHRILKVARTIADLAESDNIKTEHIAEAIQYRTKMNEELF
ncbi:YifB family Mg chelatase-like AAA ATPase [Patescibacteria group bacterium]|nr:YifB family Mg chelatase-like AAA ATPase [Patescibacteria group bacterium]